MPRNNDSVERREADRKEARAFAYSLLFFLGSLAVVATVMPGSW